MNQSSEQRIILFRRTGRSVPKYPFKDSNLGLVSNNRRVIDERRISAVIKYVIRPGYTQDSNGNRYVIDAATLIKLYRVPPNKCIVLYDNDSQFDKKFDRYVSSRYIFLYPRHDSNYSWFKDSVN